MVAQQKQSQGSHQPGKSASQLGEATTSRLCQDTGSMCGAERLPRRRAHHGSGVPLPAVRLHLALPLAPRQLGQQAAAAGGAADAAHQRRLRCTAAVAPLAQVLRAAGTPALPKAMQRPCSKSGRTSTVQGSCSLASVTCTGERQCVA